MSNLIRPTYPVHFSIGLLLLLFMLASMLSHQIFDIPFHDLEENPKVYLGMMLTGVAVLIMVLIIWEEFLFPVKAKLVPGGFEYRNHRSKLLIQILIYLSIPAIFTFIYFEFPVNQVRFWIWAVLCTLTPAIEKLATGINNYNDFLRLTDKSIAFKNNEKEGRYSLKDVTKLNLVQDQAQGVMKIALVFDSGQELTIDLDEMELEAFYDSITNFISTTYAHLRQ